MFTGIIQEIGAVRQVETKGQGLAMQVTALKTASRLRIGDSVNINGACQTAVDVRREWFEVLATAESVARTNFHYLRSGDAVNLELPLTLNDPLGGHVIMGHVDQAGVIAAIKPGPESTLLQVSFRGEFGRYVVEKGPIAVDGISLTAFGVGQDVFSVSLIPETIEHTNLKFRRAGDAVNLEFDIIGKYVEKLLSGGGSLSWDSLIKHGFVR